MLPVTSGIYKITCIANKKIYIGSALNLRKRKRQHFSDLRRNRHKNIHLQRAWNKHTESFFTFEIIELVLPMSLTSREQYWLNKLAPYGKKGFNIAHDTSQSTLGLKHTPEDLKKMRGRKLTPEQIERSRQSRTGVKNTPQHNEHISQAKRGIKQSPEHIEKLRQVRIGRKPTLETRERMRQSHLARYAKRRGVDNKFS